MFVSDLRKAGRFFPGTKVSSTNNTDRHDIAELLLKVALSTIKHPPTPNIKVHVHVQNLCQFGVQHFNKY